MSEVYIYVFHLLCTYTAAVITSVGFASQPFFCDTQGWAGFCKNFHNELLNFNSVIA